ncbi:Sec-independent protein translocase protein TatB [Pseudoxanthomonas wuyuanensis]|uniref:Sec-independent protein translocase protein TatB n=1 Tax=Pseudoxanthomonas wuyuanensis TaxID=1073196 RepID=A0A286D8J8_9GAMM|nr:Sec-independent protein translocase protein TatB [Pseudoxanthomonas wuyuanensis]KAF1720246.1 twin-arginine translocase subunit TatB [Pseudoxanthomonas wuyuanensis]SOD54975.1 sec-independent protein translocase protein TatB [Pseudoxanthomonas wuyuanensis]
MFDLGFSELLIVAVVALVVLGPERLPKAARFVGLWVRRARSQWDSVKSELERDLAAEELKRNLKSAQDALRDTEQQIRDSGQQARREFDEIRASVQDKPAPDADAGAAPPADPESQDQPQDGQGDEPRNP